MLAPGPHSELEESAEPAEIKRPGMAVRLYWLPSPILYLLFSSALGEGATDAVVATTWGLSCSVLLFPPLQFILSFV